MSSKFFNSELVQAELREIENLQEKVFRNFFNFNSLSKAGKLEQAKSDIFDGIKQKASEVVDMKRVETSVNWTEKQPESTES